MVGRGWPALRPRARARRPRYCWTALVLVHGYFSDSDSWQRSGVLRRRRWPAGSSPGTGSRTGWCGGLELVGNLRAFAIDTVDLPSTAPLMEQGALARRDAGRHRRTGHRTDGRPHRAFGRRRRGRLAPGWSPARARSPGHHHCRPTPGNRARAGGAGRHRRPRAVRRDQALFGETPGGDDLHRPRQFRAGPSRTSPRSVPGNLRHWLNGRQHPDIGYVAVVRGVAYGMPGDQVVPAPSQDLRLVPALNGRASILLVAGGHELSRVDGLVLSDSVSNSLAPPAAPSQ